METILIVFFTIKYQQLLTLLTTIPKRFNVTYMKWPNKYNNNRIINHVYLSNRDNYVRLKNDLNTDYNIN